MSRSSSTYLTLAERDHRALLGLATAGGRSSPVTDDLLFKLEHVRIAPDDAAPADAAGIGSTVTYRPDNGPERTVTLVMPGEADISAGRISVLTPVGIALIGLRPGQSAEWLARDGSERSLEVLSVHQGELVD